MIVFAHKVALVLDRLARTHGVPNSFNLAELVPLVAGRFWPRLGLVPRWH